MKPYRTLRMIWLHFIISQADTFSGSLKSMLKNVLFSVVEMKKAIQGDNESHVHLYIRALVTPWCFYDYSWYGIWFGAIRDG